MVGKAKRSHWSCLYQGKCEPQTVSHPGRIEEIRGGGPHISFNSPVWSVQETGEWWRMAVNYQTLKPILTLIAAATLDMMSSLKAD